MTHLIINQSESAVEFCPSEVVIKFYELLQSGIFDQFSNIKGNIHVNAAYQEYIDYIQNHPVCKQNDNTTFHITPTQYYMFFQNQNITNFLKDSMGDGIGVYKNTAQQVIAVPTMTGLVGDFSELDKFSSITLLPTGCFSEMSISKIYSSHVTEIKGEVFPSMVEEIILPNAVFKDSGRYRKPGWWGNTNLTKVVLPNMFDISAGATETLVDVNRFEGCTNLVECDVSNATKLVGEIFKNCSKLDHLEFNKLEKIGVNGTFYGVPRLRWIKLNANFMCTLETYGRIFDGSFQGFVYVPDNLKSVYQSDSQWANLSIRPLSQFSTDFPNG